MLNVAKEVAALERMTIGQLRTRYAEVFGEQTNGRHREWLIKRIAGTAGNDALLAGL